MTEQDRVLIDVYGRYAVERRAGERVAALASVSGVSGTVAHLRLVRLLNDGEAWAYSPATMRLIRSRVERARAGRAVTSWG